MSAESKPLNTDQFILSTKEASALLRVNSVRVRELAEAGEIPGFRVGKNWRYRRSDLVAWVDRQVEASR